MKDCTYKLDINKVKIKIDKDLSESELNNLLLSNISKFYSLIPNSNNLFSYDKTTSDILNSIKSESQSRLSTYRKAKLELYRANKDIKSGEKAKSKLEDKSDNSIAVLNWIQSKGLAKDVDIDKYTEAEKVNLKKSGKSDKEADKIINDNITRWDYSRRIGKGLHYIMEYALTNRSHFNKNTITPDKIKEKLKKSQDGEYNLDATLEGVSDETMVSYFESITKLIKELNIKKEDRLEVEFIIDRKIGDELVCGKIDILVHRSDGTIDLYDIKTSSEIVTE